VGGYDENKFWAERRAATEEIRKAINETLAPYHAECFQVQIIRTKLSDRKEGDLLRT